MNLLIITQKVDQNDPILGFFHRWLLEFAKYGENLTVICLEEGIHHLPDDIHILSLRKPALGRPVSGWRKLVMRIHYALRLYRYIWSRRSEYDAVLVHMNPIYLILGGPFWKLMGKSTALWYTHKSVNLTLRIGVFFADHIFTASRESFRLPTKKMIITGHAIDTSYFVPRAHTRRTPVTILTVGRITPVKKLDVLIRVTQKLVEKGNAVSVRIVGGTTSAKEKLCKKKLEEMTTKLRLAQHITFVGPLLHHDVLSELQQADLFVNFSDTGSLDKAVLEAMSAGVPVITSNVAFKDLLDVYHNQLFTTNDPREIVEKIQAIMYTDTALIGLALRKKVEEKHALATTILKIVQNI